MKDLAGWMQAGIATVVATLGATFLAGSSSSTLAQDTSRIERVEQLLAVDHDNVTSLKAEVHDMHSDVGEIKQDVKSLLKEKH